MESYSQEEEDDQGFCYTQLVLLFEDDQINPELSKEDKGQVKDLLEEYLEKIVDDFKDVARTMVINTRI